MSSERSHARNLTDLAKVFTLGMIYVFVLSVGTCLSEIQKGLSYVAGKLSGREGSGAHQPVAQDQQAR